ncbi:hypothetical protein FRC02_000173 [Tulasnella sp. 418]|nr:hypothetical protein FRC02_000173 [Tulasnella sp. 418]
MSIEQAHGLPPILEIEDKPGCLAHVISTLPLPTALPDASDEEVKPAAKQPEPPTLEPAPPAVATIDDHIQFWSTYERISEAFDKETLDGWNKSLDMLLIFSALFSAINTAFVIESFTSIQSDPLVTTNTLLRLSLIHRNDEQAFTMQDLNFDSVPTRSAVAITSVFFTSLTFSLSAAFGAVTAKQWLTEYATTGYLTPLYDQGRRRQLKFNGLKMWRIKLLIELLPVLVQISLFLFVLGLVPYLWYIDSTVAAIQLVLFVAGLISYIITVLIGILVPNSPFQTPISRQLRRSIANVGRLMENVIRLPSPITSLWSKLRSIKIFHPSTKGDKARELGTKEGKRESMAAPSAGKNSRLARWLGKRGSDHQRLSQMPSDYSPRWDPRDITASQSLLWLLEHGEHSDVLLTGLDAVPRLPPDLLFSLIEKREGLLERLIQSHQCAGLDTYARKGWVEQAQGWPDKILFSGVALCHILKARKLEVPPKAASLYFTLDDVPIDAVTVAKLAVYSTLQHHLMPGDDNGIDFKSFLILLRQSISVTFRIEVEPMDLRHSSSNAPYSREISTFSILLDYLIHSACQDGLKLLEVYHTELGVRVRDFLEVIQLALQGEVSHDTVSHISLALIAIQRWCGPNRESPMWSYPSAEEDMQLRSLFNNAYYALDKGKFMLENVALAISVVDDTHLPIIFDVYRTLLHLTLPLYFQRFSREREAGGAYTLYPKFAVGLLRLARHSTHDIQTQYQILNFLSQYPDKSWLLPLPEGQKEDAILLIDSMFSPSAPYIGHFVHFGLGMLDSVVREYDESQLSEFLFSDRGYHRYCMAIEGHYRSDYFGGSRGFTFLRRVLLLQASGEGMETQKKLLKLQIDLCLIVLDDTSTIKPPAESGTFMLQEYFNQMMAEDLNLEWPAYFLTAGIIATDANAQTQDPPKRLSFIYPESITHQVRGKAHSQAFHVRYVWEGEGILLLWRKAKADYANGRLPADWNDSAFFHHQKVFRIIRYLHAIFTQQYGGFDRSTVEDYLHRVLQLANRDAEEQKCADKGDASEREDAVDDGDTSGFVGLQEVEGLYQWDFQDSVQRTRRLVERALQMLDSSSRC